MGRISSNQTKEALALALKELMRQNEFEKITVSDICTSCGITRKGFYYHFQDKYDLVAWIFRSEFVDQRDFADYKENWLKILDDLCRYFYSEKQFYQKVLEIQGQNSFRDSFYEIMYPVIEAHAKRLFGNSGRHMKFFISFFCEGILAVILSWLRDGGEIPVEEFIVSVHYIIDTLAKDTEAERKWKI